MSTDAWTCPHCGTALHQVRPAVAAVNPGTGALEPIPNLTAGLCSACSGLSLQLDGLQIYPPPALGPTPSHDLPAQAKEVYLEARRVGAASPRAAVALLRLSLEVVVKDLVPGARDLNAGIADLVRRGLPTWTQQAMDAVRVTGNDAVHAGQILLHEDADIVEAMFMLVNVVVEYMVTMPRMAGTAYSAIPERLRAAINKRDAPQRTPGS